MILALWYFQCISIVSPMKMLSFQQNISKPQDDLLLQDENEIL